MLIRIIDTEIVETTLAELKSENKNISFPTILTDEQLLRFGVYRVYSNPIPTIDYTKNIESNITLVSENRYEMVHTVVDATQQEIDTRIENEWSKVRAKRNQLLLDCDWTQLEDAPIEYVKKEEWKMYRQELRDVTKTTSNPFNVIFPTKFD